MICERHQALAAYMEHGIAYCLGCMREAVIEADTVELMKVIEWPKALSLTELLARLRGESHGNREAA